MDAWGIRLRVRGGEGRCSVVLTLLRDSIWMQIAIVSRVNSSSFLVTRTCRVALSPNLPDKM